MPKRIPRIKDEQLVTFSVRLLQEDYDTLKNRYAKLGLGRVLRALAHDQAEKIRAKQQEELEDAEQGRES